MSTRRTFTADFALGDEVAIIRTEHGWLDGSIGGPIVEISDYTCVVEVTNDPIYNGRYEIPKPRDIRLVARATTIPAHAPGRYSNR